MLIAEQELYKAGVLAVSIEKANLRQMSRATFCDREGFDHEYADATPPGSVKQRQYVLLAGIAAIVIGHAVGCGAHQLHP